MVDSETTINDQELIKKKMEPGQRGDKLWLTRTADDCSGFDPQRSADSTALIKKGSSTSRMHRIGALSSHNKWPTVAATRPVQRTDVSRQRRRGGFRRSGFTGGTDR